MNQKSRDGNHVAMEALMVHGHATAATRAIWCGEIGTVGRAIYALPTDLDRRSGT
jgi:hypothetical protein